MATAPQRPSRAAAGPSQANGNPADKIITHKLFRSLHGGSGDADDVHMNHRLEDYFNISQVTTQYNRAHGSIDPRWPGQMRQGFKVVRMSQTNHDAVPVFAQEWFDTGGVYPAIFYLVGKKIMKIMFGNTTEVGSDALVNNAVSGMFDDDGSGIPYLYASFGSAGTNFIKRMNRAQTVTTSADVTAGQMLALNGKAYRTVQPTSGTSECQISVCPYGKDRFVNANWTTAVTVGFAGTGINVLTAVKNAPVAIKPEGIFAYIERLDRWVDFTPSWWKFMNLDNGKGAFFIGDQLVIPMGDGGAAIFDGNKVMPFDPIDLTSTPNVHTTKPKFSTMAATRHWIVGATGPSLGSYTSPKMISAGNSLRAFSTVDNTSFTDRTAVLRDLDLTTFYTLDTANAALKIYIGWTRPFAAFHFDPIGVNSAAATMTVKVGTVDGGSAAADTWSTVNVVDFTSLAGATFGQKGDVTFTADPVQAGWVQTTVNGVKMYWIQINVSAGMNAGQWVNCKIQPWYPSIDTTLFPLDGLDKSGNFPHIMYGAADAVSKATWYDMVSLPRPDNIGCLLFGDVGGSGLNTSRHLLAIGRFNVWVILTADDDRPGLESAPILNEVGLVECSSIVVEPGKLCRLKEVRINGHDFDPAWKFNMYYTWDSGKPWIKFGSDGVLPTVHYADKDDGKGVRFRWAFGWSGTAGEALSQGCVTDIEADFLVVGRAYNKTQDRPVQSLPRI